MDYSGILKRAWNVTWKYKILWLFGLFAGAGGGGASSSSSNSSSSNGSFPGTGTSGPQSWDSFMSIVRPYLAIAIVVTVLLVLIGIVWWILSFAARGGLIHLVNEAEEGRAVDGGDGWRRGFGTWGRVFVVGFLADLPVFLLAFVMAAAVVLLVIGAASRSGGSSSAAAGPAIVAAVGGSCCLLAVFVVAILVVGVVLSIVKELAYRYAVIEERGAVESLKQGWRDLRAKRGAFVMWLIQFGVSLAYGIVVFIVSLVLILPAVVLLIARAWLPGGMLLTFAVLLLLVPGAVYATFYHAVWTIFFRRMTGLEATPAMAVGVPGGAMPGAGYPPPPPSGMEVAVAPQADPWVAAHSLPDDAPAVPAPPAPPTWAGPEIQPEPSADGAPLPPPAGPPASDE